MSDRRAIARLLSPASLAVVGANETLGMSNNAVLPMLEVGRTVHLVNPTRPEIYGLSALPSLSALGAPVDAVLSLVNAERSVAVVEEAAALGCGGVVVAAAGFSEMGEAGSSLQRRLQDVARDSGLAVIGPNCAGFKNVPLGVNLFTGGRIDPPAGGVSIVSQSGFLMRSALAAAVQRRLGIATAVSSGNEAVCDLADYVEALIDDSSTSVICLVIETIRRPAAFFSAVARAHRAGMAVLALKLGRSDRARQIVQSHTGAITGENWVYELALAEHGIVSARDVDDLLDCAQLVAQLPADRHSPLGRIGIITTSGGVAALATDLADREDVQLPTLEELAPWVRERVPGDTVNPLDLTGFVMNQPDVMRELFDRYAGAVDALVLAWWLGEGDEAWSTTLLGPFAAAATEHSIPFVVSPVEATSLGPWVDAWRQRGLVFTRGLRSLYRATAAMAPSTSYRPAAAVSDFTPMESPLSLVRTPVGPIVHFTDAMRLLSEAGLPVAPYCVLGEHDDPSVATDLGPYLVAKLADVPHRTECDAVMVDVPASGLPEAVDRLRRLARAQALPVEVAVQAMVPGFGEAFAGLQARSELGPLVLLGFGGVLVETSGRVSGRFLPIDREAAESLVEEVAGADVFAALRGTRPWPTAPLVEAIMALDRLWRASGAWLGSLDVNPLIVTEAGVVAVDALFVAAEEGVEVDPWPTT
jgi:acetate---CoA ligase (ADP-forming)